MEHWARWSYGNLSTAQHPQPVLARRGLQFVTSFGGGRGASTPSNFSGFARGISQAIAIVFVAKNAGHSARMRLYGAPCLEYLYWVRGPQSLAVNCGVLFRCR